ncbi:MAG: GlcNAc-transferase family protein [Methylophilaceae bacterium]
MSTHSPESNPVREYPDTGQKQATNAESAPKYTPRQPHPTMPGTIFVSIANYRDNEAPRTLRDLYANAAQPERIFVGVFSQVIPEEDGDCLPADGFPPNQVRQLYIHADEGLGACWARSRILTELYQGEDYILQIDSHSRFVPGWDNGFIAMLGKCASSQPILTTYPAGYYPPNVFGHPHTPILAGLEFNSSGVLLVKGIITDEFEFPPTPKPSAFLSGNCLFGSAQAFQQVPYDPYLYFHGEEISYAVRMWTHGWDLFAPNDVLMYTDYVANRGRRRHWDDQKRWHELNTRSFQRLRHLFRVEKSNDPEVIHEFERYDLGNVRTLAQYEAFADVSFATHYFGPRALEAHFPLPDQSPDAFYSPSPPKIFVSIASYRDSETAATIRDLFARAAQPERVFVGICTQIIPDMDEHCLPDAHPNVREMRVHAAQSRGPCWARYHILDQLLHDEEFVLQIDSHSRFSQGWDERFIAMLYECPSLFPVLSSSPASYEPPQELSEPYYSVCSAENFSADGVLTLGSRPIHKSEKPAAPLPAAFICGGQLFGPTQAFKQAPPDPYLYFNGEEIAYSARLWTHGWDIFAPNDALVYHEYNLSRGRPCHWHNHANWDELNQLSFARVRHLLGTQTSQNANVLAEIERFGLGNTRSLAEYEIYADVRFVERTVGSRAADGRFPSPQYAETMQ